MRRPREFVLLGTLITFASCGGQDLTGPIVGEGSLIYVMRVGCPEFFIASQPWVCQERHDFARGDTVTLFSGIADTSANLFIPPIRTAAVCATWFEIRRGDNMIDAVPFGHSCADSTDARVRHGGAAELYAAYAWWVIPPNAARGDYSVRSVVLRDPDLLLQVGFTVH
jgi:hypothetical protein